jgi:hypothetical protein
VCKFQRQASHRGEGGRSAEHIQTSPLAQSTSASLPPHVRPQIQIPRHHRVLTPPPCKPRLCAPPSQCGPNQVDPSSAFPCTKLTSQTLDRPTFIRPYHVGGCAALPPSFARQASVGLDTPQFCCPAELACGQRFSHSLQTEISSINCLDISPLTIIMEQYVSFIQQSGVIVCQIYL